MRDKEYMNELNNTISMFNSWIAARHRGKFDAYRTKRLEKARNMLQDYRAILKEVKKCD